MREFSLSRVASYMRYNYTVQAKNYVWNVLSMFAVPLLFAVLAKDLYAASGMSMFVYILAAIVFPAREVWLMRDRGTRIMDMTLPVSNEERWMSMFINLAVVLPIVSMVTTVLAIIVAVPFNECAIPGMELNGFIGIHFDKCYLHWPIYVFVQLLASSSLCLAILARRSLIVTYIGAFVGVILFLYVVVDVAVVNEWSINIEAHIKTVEVVGKVVFSLLPVLFYILSYVALRKRQIKW